MADAKDIADDYKDSHGQVGTLARAYLELRAAYIGDDARKQRDRVLGDRNQLAEKLLAAVTERAALREALEAIAGERCICTDDSPNYNPECPACEPRDYAERKLAPTPARGEDR